MTNQTPETITKTVPILELIEVEAFAGHEKAIQLRGFTGRLLPGQLTHVRMDYQRDLRTLASLFLGLGTPDQGVIRYCGDTWLGTDYQRHFRMRSQIGRVYAGPGWVQNLTVGENVRIGPLNQNQKLSDVSKAIEHWIPRLAGPHAQTVERSLSRRPAFVADSILQICQLIRALAIEPRLLILESPRDYLPLELNEHLLAAITDVCTRGGAAIWFDSDDLPELPKDTVQIQRWTISHDALEIVSEGAA